MGNLILVIFCLKNANTCVNYRNTNNSQTLSAALTSDILIWPFFTFWVKIPFNQY